MKLRIQLADVPSTTSHPLRLRTHVNAVWQEQVAASLPKSHGQAGVHSMPRDTHRPYIGLRTLARQWERLVGSAVQ